MSKEKQEVESLGKWDHGMSDPRSDDEGSDDEEETPSFETLANGLCGKGLVRRVVKAEHLLEGCLRGAILRMEDRVERLMVPDQNDATSQDAGEEIRGKKE